jgi:hypothetical protein
MLSQLSSLSANLSVLPTYRGYISVAPSKRYFQDEDGKGFVVIGHNDAITWPGMVELLQNSSLETAEAYIQDLRAHGVNVSRVMLEYAQFEMGYLENPLGVFNPSVVRFWDEFIALAERHGLYLLLTPYDTFWQVINWKNYPYSAEMGGPCEALREWLIAPEVIAAQKRRWEFVIERWGKSPNILAWDLMNEIDLYWGSTPDEIEHYLTEMAAFVRETEMRIWGRTHLLTASSAAPVPSGKLGKVIYNHASLDFANTHLYVGLGVRAPIDAVEGAQEMAEGVRLSLQSTYDTRPYTDTESGPIDEWITDGKLDNIYHHNLSWAHLASGGAGSGMRWPYTEPHHLLPEMRDNLLGMARLAATMDWADFHSRNVALGIRLSKAGIVKAGCADNMRALLWLLVDNRLTNPPTLGETTIRMPNILLDGSYRVELWETYQGVMFNYFSTEVIDGKFVFTLPALPEDLADLAIVIRRTEH